MIISVIWVENQKDENEWDYILPTLKSDKVYALGGYECTNNVLKDAPRIITLDEVEEDYAIVMMSPENSRVFTPTINLQDYPHPANAIYVFGPNNQIMSENILGSKSITDTVCIPTDELFSYMAYAITMWDRAHG